MILVYYDSGGSMYPSSIYFLYGYFGANVYTVWAHGPLGYVNHCLVDPTGLLNLVGVCRGLSMAGVSGQDLEL